MPHQHGSWVQPRSVSEGRGWAPGNCLLAVKGSGVLDSMIFSHGLCRLRLTSTINGYELWLLKKNYLLWVGVSLIGETSMKMDNGENKRSESKRSKEEINSKAYPCPLRVAERNCILAREIISRQSILFPLRVAERDF
uniref:Uncharacterized protein n=1 Tax=Solanum tuberosum TaxID=4113 RepID=M1DW08_SOLTU